MAGKTITRTYYRDAKGRFASKGSPGAVEVKVKHNVGKERKRLEKELSAKQQAKLVSILNKKGLSGKSIAALGKELDGLNLSELRKLTNKVGVSQPTRYRNRKASWKEAILSKAKESNANPNLGSKKRNLEKGVWVDKQLKNERIPSNAREFLKRYKKEPWLKPYPVGGMEFEVRDWKKAVLKEANRGYEAKSLIDRGRTFIERVSKPSASNAARVAELETQLIATRKEMIAMGVKSRGFSKKAERLIALEKELYEIQDKTDASKYERILDSIRGQSKLDAASARAMANKIDIDDSVPPHHRDALMQDAADFYQLTGGRGKSSMDRFDRTDSRASARQGSVNIGNYDRETIFHELGHHMEFSSPGMLQAAVSYRTEMSTSSQPEKLNKLTRIDYDDNEIALPGKYIDPYVGKVYRNKYNGEDTSTEVTSMGIQYFSSPARLKHLAETAPEYYHYMVGILTNYEVNID